MLMLMFLANDPGAPLLVLDLHVTRASKGEEQMAAVGLPSEVDLARAAAVLAASGRPALLAHLKQHGVAKLSDRQKLAGQISSAVKDGSLIAAPPAEDEDPASRLLRVVAAGDTEAVRALLLRPDCVASVDYSSASSTSKITPLIAAAENGREGALWLLISQLPSALKTIDMARKSDGYTAAMLATKNGHVNCLARLLAARANPDATTADGWSSLMIACEKNCAASVDALLHAGASPTQGVHNGWAVVLTPLKLAAIAGHSDCVQLLLEARAQVGNDDGSRMDVIEADGSTMLLYAAQRTHARDPAPGDGHVRTIKLLLEAHAEPEQTRWDGITPLAYACMYGDVEGTEVLLAHQAKPSSRDEAGWTPLLWASRRGHAACVTQLLNAGVPPCEARPNGCTALMAAAMGGHESCIEALLAARAGADAEMGSGRGLSAMMIAAANGHEAVVGRLLTSGASPYAVDRLGWTAAVHAKQSGQGACAALLEASITDISDAGSIAPPSESSPPTPSPPLPPPGSFGPVYNLSHEDSWHERCAAASATRRYHVSSSHPHFANLVQLILIEHEYIRTTNADDDWSLMWHAGQLAPEVLYKMKPHQAVNKFPHANCLTTKSQLWATFERMRKKHGATHFGFVPTTFVLPTQSEELARAMADDAPGGGRAKSKSAVVGDHDALSAERAADPPERVWIVKPVAACRGQGISLHRSTSGLPDDVASRRAIASVYIDPPYLIDERKVDLRLYVLVTSWRPLVVYLHREGLARLATQPYALADLDDTQRHLTNYAINKKAVTADGDGSGPKIDLREFHDRLVADVGDTRARAAWCAIDDAIVKMLIAAEPPMGQAVATFVPPNGCRCFQLFGFDVMLDAECRPWVLEVNLDPSLATDSPLDLRVKSAVITDLLNLVGIRSEGAEAQEGAHDRQGGQGGCNSQGDNVTSGARADNMTDEEAKIVQRVATEMQRALGGGWRRLHPSPLSARGQYEPFFDASRRRIHTLPFDGC